MEPPIDHPTSVLRAPLREDPGLLIGTDGSAWLYRQVPRAPVTDARTPQDRDLAAGPINGLVAELAATTGVLIKRRRLNKAGYREIHVLSTIAPSTFTAPQGHPNASLLNDYFSDMRVLHRNLLLGVRLRSSARRGTWRHTVADFVDSMIEGGAALEDWMGDAAAVGTMFDHYGYTIPDQEHIGAALAWFNDGAHPDVITYPHGDHLHVFGSWSAAQMAHRAVTNNTDCAQWRIEHHSVMTIACLDSFGGGWEIDSTDPEAAWASRLHRDAGARAISVRALIEPAAVTRGEMRRHRREYEHDLAKAQLQGRMDKAEAETATANLAATERAYAKTPPPTLTDVRVSVAVDGVFTDPSAIGAGTGNILLTRPNRQEELRTEMGLCSPVRENPHVRDWPAQVLAASGVGDASVVGDGAASTVLIGFAEHDQEIAGYEPSRAGNEDSAPATFVAGDTGTGKTQLLLWMASQEVRAGRDVVSFSPKAMSSADRLVENIAGRPGADGSPVQARTVTLSDLTGVDGVLDPLGYDQDISAAVNRAAANILSVNPWGTATARSLWESALVQALRRGAQAGARTTGQALLRAKEAGAPAEMVDAVLDLAGAYPQFRAFVGSDSGRAARHSLRGWTHIQVGSSPLNLPDEQALAAGDVTLSQRVDVTLVRALINTYIHLLRERGGSVYLDEAWVFLLVGRSELDAAGRLAREYGVSMVLFNQKVSEMRGAGLEGYFSRSLILPLKDRVEAETALHIAGPDLVTPERLTRLQARATKGEGRSVVPNWESMRHLAARNGNGGTVKNPDGSDKTVRGAVAYYADLDGHCVPVEIVLPPEFLSLSTTNAGVLLARRRAARAGAGTAPGA